MRSGLEEQRLRRAYDHSTLSAHMHACIDVMRGTCALGSRSVERDGVGMMSALVGRISDKHAHVCIASRIARVDCMRA